MLNEGWFEKRSKKIALDLNKKPGRDFGPMIATVVVSLLSPDDCNGFRPPETITEAGATAFLAALFPTILV